MKDIVVHVMDSVCASNNRDPAATALIDAAKTFGTVETLEQATASIRAKYQSEIDNIKLQHETEISALKAKLFAIEERGITDAEFEILKALRKKADAEACAFKAEIQRRDDQLSAIVAECENRKQQIKTLYGL